MSAPSPEVSLQEPFFLTNSAKLRRWVPWIRLLEGFRQSTEFRRMFLAFCAVVLWSAGCRFFSDWSGLERHSTGDVIALAWPWETDALPDVPATRERVDFENAVNSPFAFLQSMMQNGHAVLWPIKRIVFSGSELFRDSLTGAHWRYALCRFLWTVTIAAIFGGAICRMVAVDFSGTDSPSIRTAVRFAVRRTVSYLSSPLAALLGVVLLWIPLTLMGLFARIPWMGDPVVGFLWFLVWLAGLGLALIVAGLVAGFPLMVAAISVEASDAFDGLSRSYSYLFNRPWYALFLSLCLTLYGSALLYFLMGLLTLTVDCGASAVQMGYGDLRASQAFVEAPQREPFLRWQPPVENSEQGVPMSTWGQNGIGVWSRVLMTIPAAFLFSFFWTGITMMYFLLRLREDATPLNEVAIPEKSERKAPLIGIPGAAARERLRRKQTSSDEAL